MVIQTDTDGQITAVNLIRYHSCTKTTFGGLATILSYQVLGRGRDVAILWKSWQSGIPLTKKLQLDKGKAGTFHTLNSLGFFFISQ
jgi:hypothetical protein